MTYKQKLEACTTYEEKIAVAKAEQARIDAAVKTMIATVLNFEPDFRNQELVEVVRKAVVDAMWSFSIDPYTIDPFYQFVSQEDRPWRRELR
jgi:hypothetical protein